MSSEPSVASRVGLVALTPETRSAIGGAALETSAFPYRVGRESRGVTRVGATIMVERRRSGARATNEVYLRDISDPLNVSREHFQVEWRDGALRLVDRGSTCGTIVEGQPVGGRGRGGTAPLRDGDVIIVGTAFSPFVFKVRVGAPA